MTGVFDITPMQAARVIISDVRDYREHYGRLSEATIVNMIAEFCEYGDTARKQAITTIVTEHI